MVAAAWGPGHCQKGHNIFTLCFGSRTRLLANALDCDNVLLPLGHCHGVALVNSTFRVFAMAECCMGGTSIPRVKATCLVVRILNAPVSCMPTGNRGSSTKQRMLTQNQQVNL